MMSDHYSVGWQYVPQTVHPDMRMLRSAAGIKNMSLEAYRDVLRSTAESINGNGVMEFPDGGRVTTERIHLTAKFIDLAQATVGSMLEYGGFYTAQGEAIAFEEGYSPDRLVRVRENLRRYGYDYSRFSALPGTYPVSHADIPLESSILSIAPQATRFVQLQRDGRNELSLMMGTEVGRQKSNTLKAMLCAKVSSLAGNQPYIAPLAPVSAMLAELHHLNQ